MALVGVRDQLDQYGVYQAHQVGHCMVEQSLAVDVWGEGSWTSTACARRTRWGFCLPGGRVEGAS